MEKRDGQITPICARSPSLHFSAGIEEFKFSSLPDRIDRQRDRQTHQPIFWSFHDPMRLHWPGESRFQRTPYILTIGSAGTNEHWWYIRHHDCFLCSSHFLNVQSIDWGKDSLLSVFAFLKLRSGSTSKIPTTTTYVPYVGIVGQTRSHSTTDPIDEQTDVRSIFFAFPAVSVQFPKRETRKETNGSIFFILLWRVYRAFILGTHMQHLRPKIKLPLLAS